MTCSGGKALFEATCDSNGFKILINEVSLTRIHVTNNEFQSGV